MGRRARLSRAERAARDRIEAEIEATLNRFLVETVTPIAIEFEARGVSPVATTMCAVNLLREAADEIEAGVRQATGAPPASS